MEALLSWHRLFRGFFRRLVRSWLPCSMLALLAFLPLAGLTLLSPLQMDGLESLREGPFEWREFATTGLLLCRFLTPLSACLIVTYLARQDGRLPRDVSLWRSAFSNFLRSVGLVLAVAFFTAFASLFLILPGLGFFLGSSIALSVLVVEKTSVPEAVRRSWERTRYVRGALLAFWLVFSGGAVSFLAVVALVFTRGNLTDLFSLPLAESPALLPLVIASSFLYGAAICADYEIYRQLEMSDFELPPIEEKAVEP